MQGAVPPHVFGPRRLRYSREQYSTGNLTRLLSGRRLDGRIHDYSSSVPGLDKNLEQSHLATCDLAAMLNTQGDATSDCAYPVVTIHAAGLEQINKTLLITWTNGPIGMLRGGEKTLVKNGAYSPQCTIWTM